MYLSQCQINNPQSYHIPFYVATAKQELSKHSLIFFFLLKKVLFYWLLGYQWWKWRCHYYCHSSPPRDLLAQTPCQNQQCSLQNHCQKNLLDPSPHSGLKFDSFPRRIMHVYSARRHFETCNFRQFDTHITNAKTDKGTFNWNNRDYRKCPKLMQLV